jgi:hypothetical protein
MRGAGSMAFSMFYFIEIEVRASKHAGRQYQ